jgi:hypothetical protein
MLKGLNTQGSLPIMLKVTSSSHKLLAVVGYRRNDEVVALKFGMNRNRGGS